MPNYTNQQFGDYRLIRRLGEGAYGAVYLGEHVLEGTQVAIKILHEATSASVEQFRQEARTIAHLTHPHIVRLLEFDAEQGILFLVMDFAPNGTLRAKHAHGTCVPLATVLSYVKQIAGALQCAHDQGVVHGDIKQENLLIGAHNEILLTDFGIAVVIQQPRTHESGDGFRGTPIYAAPEQFDHKRRKESDQYALGVLVYEWLTGEYPFDGPTPLAIAIKKQDPPPPLRTKDPTILPMVEEVVMTALAKDPKKRFPSIRAFADALERAAQSSMDLRNPGLSAPTAVTAPEFSSLQAKGPEQFAPADVAEPEILSMVVNAEELPAASADRFIKHAGLSFSPLLDNIELAKRLRAQKQVGQAMAVLKHLCSSTPAEPIPHAELGDLYIGLGRLEQGVRELEEAVMLSLQNGRQAAAAELLQRLAVIYWEMGNQEEAIRTFLQVIQLIPDDMQVRMEMVQYCLQGGWRKEAVLQQSLIAHYYLHAHQIKEAVSALQQLIVMDKRNAGAYDLLGQVYAEIGEYEQAARVYRNLAKVAPENRLANERLTQLEKLRSNVAS